MQAEAYAPAQAAGMIASWLVLSAVLPSGCCLLQSAVHAGAPASADEKFVSGVAQCCWWGCVAGVGVPSCERLRAYLQGFLFLFCAVCHASKAIKPPPTCLEAARVAGPVKFFTFVLWFITYLEPDSFSMTIFKLYRHLTTF